MSDFIEESTASLDPPDSGTAQLTATGQVTAAESASAAASCVAVGSVLRERYVLLAELGAGGKGRVFKALDRFRATLPETDHCVALKILHAGESPELTLANLRREFHCGQVLSHKNIVNVFELDRDGDAVFFTMELLEGELLSEVIKRFRPGAIPRNQAWALIEQLGAGLAHAHERGIVHGDLKPRNLFVTRDGELRILDFGAAHRGMVGSPPSGSVPQVSNDGTPAYASCEQLEGLGAQPSDDLFALACICYEVLTGSHPFGSRPATQARDYRVSLVRPRGLTRRQWSALRAGLSWHRGGRALAVRAWMGRLAPSAPSQTLKPWRVAAGILLALSLITAAVLAKLSPTVALLASRAPPPPALAPGPKPEVAATPVAERPAIDAGTAPAGLAGPAPPAVLAGPADTAVHASPAPIAARATPLPIAVDPSQVRASDHFAEIRLSRARLQNDNRFTWWTEPATAKPDVDYLPEAAETQAFPAGFHMTHLYVKLLPQSLRSRRAFFYVVIAPLGPHQEHLRPIRRQIWLPVETNLQAQR